MIKVNDLRYLNSPEILSGMVLSTLNYFFHEEESLMLHFSPHFAPSLYVRKMNFEKQLKTCSSFCSEFSSKGTTQETCSVPLLPETMSWATCLCTEALANDVMILVGRAFDRSIGLNWVTSIEHSRWN